jgi:hypothetical protein
MITRTPSKRILISTALAIGTVSTLWAPAHADERALTIYNQNFAVVRETVPLNLTTGINHVTYNDITYHVEPDSVILRDPTGKRTLQILEQNYRADPISQDLLLSLYEGKTIDFEVTRGDKTEIVQGKIIRSGYVPHTPTTFNYNSNYYFQQQAMSLNSANQPIVEVDGKLQFSLPGKPIFPALADDSILKPTLDWTIQSDQSGPANAELAYVTGGMTWKADYNVIAPVDGDDVDLIGWITMDNQSGHTFENAKIKLMAGDVSKLQSGNGGMDIDGYATRSYALGAAPAVSEQSFDDYHLYTLDRPTTLRDRETKQVEFVHADHVQSKTIYVYDGLKVDPQYSNWGYDNIRNQPSYGTESNPKIWTMREIVNSKQNNLGIPLPKGRMRFYRKDTDSQLEFIGENDIDHTPKDETLRVYTGNAFDITGERAQTSYASDIYNKHTIDEAFAIKLRNHKKTPVEVRIVEHLYRAANWNITNNSDPFTKTDAHTIEYRVVVAPDHERAVNYEVHYTW